MGEGKMNILICKVLRTVFGTWHRTTSIFVIVVTIIEFFPYYLRLFPQSLPQIVARYQGYYFLNGFVMGYR